MPDWEIDIASDGPPLDPALSARIDTAIRTVLFAEGAGEAEISVALLGDEGMRRIHRDYLGKDSTTDVITFPLLEPGRPLIGDVYIGFDQAARQASELAIPFEEEVLRLAVHASLHLLGWDHPEGGARDLSPMYLRQEELLSQVLTASEEPGPNPREC